MDASLLVTDGYGVIQEMPAIGQERRKAMSGFSPRPVQARQRSCLASRGLHVLPPAGANVPDIGPEPLTPRESDVLRLIAAGKSNREIARALFVSEATVKTHVNRIFAKTGSRDRTQAMRYAYIHGYAAPS